MRWFSSVCLVLCAIINSTVRTSQVGKYVGKVIDLLEGVCMYTHSLTYYCFTVLVASRVDYYHQLQACLYLLPSANVLEPPLLMEIGYIGGRTGTSRMIEGPAMSVEGRLLDYLNLGG